MPIDPKNPDAFNCTKVPTLTQVINELGSSAQKSDQLKEEGESVTPPCLEPFMQTFRDFLGKSNKSQMQAIRQANKQKAQKGAASGSMDF